MRTVKPADFVALALLPVVLAAAIAFSAAPLQMTARASEPEVVLEANDIPLVVDLAADTLSPEESQPAPEGVQVGSHIEENGLDLVEYVSYEPPVVAGEVVPESSRADGATGADGRYSSDQLRVQGVIYDDGYRYTWYSQRVLPGGGLAIDGRHVSDEGYVVDSRERIVVASSDLPRGTEVDIPFGGGKAIVLDTGCASGTLDIYTDF